MGPSLTHNLWAAEGGGPSDRLRGPPPHEWGGKTPVTLRLMETTGSILGMAVRRREDPRLITGHGNFVADMPAEGALHALFVRSPVAHARIVGVDATAARAMPGVARVFAAAHLR